MPDPQCDDRDDLLLTRELARLARNYNAALYFLRQCHYFFKYINQQPVPPLADNPHGPLDPDPPYQLLTSPKSYDELKNTAPKAERAFQIAACALETLLEPDAKLSVPVNGKPKILNIQLTAADMIQINGYIVSMRVTTNPPVQLTGKEVAAHEGPFEIVGSSSHVSISSAFSSG
jgi:hypothetical protein